MAIPPVEGFVRVGGLHFVYAEAAEKSYCDYVRLSHQIEAYGCIEYDENLQNLNYDKTIAGLQTVVFSAMCFEAAIYDFASIYLGDDYVRDHLDKLDVLSKWLVVMRFISGIEIPKGVAPYGALKNLVAERNRLVHSKSEPMDMGNRERQIARMLKRESEFENGVHNSIRAIILMSLFLEAVQEGHHNPLPSYSKQNAPLRRHFSELRNVIEECRNVVAKIGRG